MGPAPLESGAQRVRGEAHDMAYEGAPFEYPGRCLEELKRGHAGLSEGARLQVDAVLEAHARPAPLSA